MFLIVFVLEKILRRLKVGFWPIKKFSRSTSIKENARDDWATSQPTHPPHHPHASSFSYFHVVTGRSYATRRLRQKNVELSPTDLRDNYLRLSEFDNS